MSEKKHKAGFVNIVGSPNVGKSTLMNALVGEKLSIITSKVQTTRHRILGILNGEDFQIVYSDTPGIIKNPTYELHKAMNDFVHTALDDADVILYVTEARGDHAHEKIMERLTTAEIPVVIAVNKIDESEQDAVEKKVLEWRERVPKAFVLPISALHEFNVDHLLDVLLHVLPESPAYYPKDELTDKTMRFFVSEIIREKILLNYKKEVPYSAEVAVEDYKEDDSRIHIRANIYVMRETQKGIILGHKGSMIKKTGMEARLDIEEFVNKRVFLDLTVKVSKDWRENESNLKRFGYKQ